MMADRTDTPAALLRMAANAIDAAVRQLDMTSTTCGECDSRHYTNLVEFQVGRNVQGMVPRLRREAGYLEGDRRAPRAAHEE